MSKPAFVKHFVTASMIALLVIVAPDTTSTAKLCVSTIFSGILLIAKKSLIPGVSECSFTTTLAILHLLTTSTLTSP